MNSETWVFGYGSLIWRPDFVSLEAVPARLNGWSRRFWQGSTDHRGVPGAPGRVATLVRESDAICWGMAFRLPNGETSGIYRKLDHRERGGYERHQVSLAARDGRLLHDVCLYVAKADNPSYLGPADIATIAEQVAGAHGPSGSNREYVLRLHDALCELDVPDPHVAAIAAHLSTVGASGA
jgi:cation transport protein ChaC